MKTRFPIFATALVFAFVPRLLASHELAASSATDGPRLPGARPELDASRFPSLQAAFDALPAEGGLIRLPVGRFEISEPLVLSRGDVHLAGTGPGTHIVNVNRQGRPALIVRHRDGERAAADQRLWRVMLSNFRITGNEQSGTGIEAVQIQEIFVQGVTVSHHGGHGIYLNHCYEDPRVNDCLITYNKGSGLHLAGCHDIVVSGNQFEENLDAVQCLDGFNLCMTGNNLDDHLRNGIVIENTYGSVVSGNMIEECREAAMVLDRDCYGNTLSANVIAHNGAGILLRDAHGCAVSANIFTINGREALRIGPESGRITVVGNNFSNSLVGQGKVVRAPDDLAAAGIVLSSTSEIAISGNLFAGLRPKGVIVEGEPSHTVLFSSNVLVDAPSEHERLQRSKTDGNLMPSP